MKEEDFIRKKCGDGNPFRVPEGYFEQFSADLMQKLPEKEASPLSIPLPSRRKPALRAAWYAAAATVCGIVLFGTHYFRSSRLNAPMPTYSTEYVESGEVYMDDLLDYAMVSNQEIAMYLTETD